MKKGMKIKKIKLQDLSSDSSEIIDQMYEVYKVCFEGWSKDEFSQYITKIDPKPSVILLIYDKNKLVGYNLTIIRNYVVNRKIIAVISVDLALLPKYRGQVPNLTYVFLNVVLFKIRHPFTPSFYVDILMNYKLYHTMVKYIGMMPSPQREIPKIYRHLIEEVISRLGYTLENGGYAVYTHDKIFYEIPKHSAIINSTLHQYFMEKTSHETRGLVVFSPATYWLWFKGICKLFLAIVNKKIK